jgi:hypothetical protein
MEVVILTMFFCLQLPVSDTADIREFYRVFSSGTLEEVNIGIKNLGSARHLSKINAYQGAMLMKKAVLEKTPEAKLSTFKKGYGLLEAEISKSPQNAEFRFLRLAIQEHAPEILKYNKNLQDDRNIVIVGYKNLDPLIQEFILQYGVKSKVLTVKDLQ